MKKLEKLIFRAFLSKQLLKGYLRFEANKFVRF